MKHQALGEHLTDLELRYTVECQCVPLRYVLVCVTRVELQYARMLEPPDRARGDLEGHT